jgi:hypothetical protein
VRLVADSRHDYDYALPEPGVATLLVVAAICAMWRVR